MLLTCWLIPLYISLIIPSTHGYLNLYMSPREAFRLIGIQSEIYYVKDGFVNDYALGFVMKVDSSISDLHFNWRSLIPTPMPYAISLNIDNLSPLGIPHINITRQGFVPTKEQVFRIGLPCTGKEDAEVNISINLNITVLPLERTTVLVLRRNRICSKGLAHTPIEETDTTVANASLMISNTSPVYFFYTIAVFILFVVVVFICIKLCH